MESIVSVLIIMAITLLLFQLYAKLGEIQPIIEEEKEQSCVRGFQATKHGAGEQWGADLPPVGRRGASVGHFPFILRS